MRNARLLTIKKVLFIMLSTFLVAVGITLFLQSSLGSDPMTVWVQGLSRALEMPLGNASLLSNGVMLAFALVFARRYIHLGTIISALGTGPILTLLVPLIHHWAGPLPGLSLRILMMLLGHVIMCCGIALNLSVKFGFITPDALIVTICDRFHFKYRYIRIAADLIFTLAGIFLGGIIGIGSLVAGLTGGPIISWLRTRMTDPLMKRVGVTDIPISNEFGV